MYVPFRHRPYPGNCSSLEEIQEFVRGVEIRDEWFHANLNWWRSEPEAVKNAFEERFHVGIAEYKRSEGRVLIRSYHPMPLRPLSAITFLISGRGVCRVIAFVSDFSRLKRRST